MKLLSGILILLLFQLQSHAQNNSVIIIETELGDLEIEIYRKKAPITANNFLEYIEKEMFEGASFYRTVTMDNQPDNMVKIEVIQGGLGWVDSLPRLDPIQHETTEKTGILHKSGVISMARAEPGTADAEFFICIGDQPSLDYGGLRNPDGQGFAAFGQVIDGMEVVHKIHRQPSKEQMLDPVIRITRVYRKS